MRSTLEKKIAKLEQRKRELTGGGYSVIPPITPDKFISEKEYKKRINKNLEAMAPGSRYIAVGFGEWVKDMSGRLRRVFAFDRETFLRMRNESIKVQDEIKKEEDIKAIKKIKKAQPIKPQASQETRKKEDDEEKHITKIKCSIARDFPNARQ